MKDRVVDEWESEYGQKACLAADGTKRVSNRHRKCHDVNRQKQSLAHHRRDQFHQSSQYQVVEPRRIETRVQHEVVSKNREIGPEPVADDAGVVEMRWTVLGGEVGKQPERRQMKNQQPVEDG